MQEFCLLKTILKLIDLQQRTSYSLFLYTRLLTVKYPPWEGGEPYFRTFIQKVPKRINFYEHQIQASWIIEQSLETHNLPINLRTIPRLGIIQLNYNQATVISHNIYHNLITCNDKFSCKMGTFCRCYDELNVYGYCNLG